MVRSRSINVLLQGLGCLLVGFGGVLGLGTSLLVVLFCRRSGDYVSSGPCREAVVGAVWPVCISFMLVVLGWFTHRGASRNLRALQAGSARGAA